MYKKISIIILSISLSFISIYLISDKFLLPFYLYKSEVVIPDMIGANISESKNNLLKLDLNVNIQYVTSQRNDEIGMIIHTNPIMNTVVKKGTVIDVKVYGARESYKVPNLKYKSKSVALNMLRSVGLTVDTIIYDYKDIICTNPYDSIFKDNFDELINNCEDFPKNMVWNQFPRPGEKYYKNDLITLFISKGVFAPDLYDVPILIDKDYSQAIKLINKSGLLLGDVIYSDAGYKKGRVIDQSEYGKCRINDKINLTVQK